MYTCATRFMWHLHLSYGVATISRHLKMIGLLCKRALWNRQHSAKETYNFKEPTNRSHPIPLKSGASMTYDSFVYAQRDSFINITLSYMCNVTHQISQASVTHNSIMHIGVCATWLKHICATWLIHTCVQTVCGYTTFRALLSICGSWD